MAPLPGSGFWAVSFYSAAAQLDIMHGALANQKANLAAGAAFSKDNSKGA
jgi:hypothetical protein